MKEDRNFPEYFREIPCNQHPDSSHVGICPHCLKDRLVRLVCTDCGNCRVSSCSCSEIIDVGSVGRISFLIDTEKRKKLIFFGRSNSSRVGMKKSKGFWRLFRKRKSTNGEFCDDVNSEICSFRDSDDFKNNISDVFFDRQMEIDNRVCSVFPIKECGLDESEFFELKQEIINGGSDDLASLKGKGVYRKGGSCRITMNERGLKQGMISRNYNVWRWFFKDDNGGNYK